MLNKEKMLKEIDEMPIEKLRECLCKALEDSDIEYHIYENGEEVPEGTTTLSDFLQDIIEDIRQLKEERLKENIAG